MCTHTAEGVNNREREEEKSDKGSGAPAFCVWSLIEFHY